MSESTWQVITPTSQPKAPVTLGKRDELTGEVATVHCTDDRDARAAIRHCHYTHFIQVTLPPFPEKATEPTKHPAEAAFEEWSSDGNNRLYHSEYAFKAGWQKALQYAAKELCEPHHYDIGGNWISEQTMRDRLSEAAEELK